MTRKRILLALTASLPALVLLGAEKDLGTGYELENVQVLDPSMRLADARLYMVTLNDALGVQCRDCHDLRNFASDEPPLKLVAREMMKMEKELNEKWFADSESQVSCFTCHQGQRIPPGVDSTAATD